MVDSPKNAVCGCLPVTFLISARVARLARFIQALTSAFWAGVSYAFGWALRW